MSTPSVKSNIKCEQSDTGGVVPMSIEGRMGRERERTLGMTDGERAWRAQYLRDQHLDPSEPIVPAGYEKARYNIFRRIYRYPLNRVEVMIAPIVGREAAHSIRIQVGKYIMGSLLVFYMIYNMKYMQNDNWRRQGGFRVFKSRPLMLPDDPNYPNWERRTSFALNGFDRSPI